VPSILSLGRSPISTVFARPSRLLCCAIAASIAAFALSGCSTIRHVFHTGNKPSQRNEQLQILQLRNMRFADDYVGSIVGPIRLFQASTEDATDRLTAQNWMLSQATAAYTIASGPSPVVNAVDLVVLATLSRMVVDDAWSGERFGDRAAALRDVYRRLEPQALEIVRQAIPPAQLAALEEAILAWRAQNPHTTSVSYVHFRDVANSVARPTRGGNDSFSGLFNMLGLDPFSSLDPAVRELSQTRVLAERTIYYAQRVPTLLDMQVERLTFEFATMPETKRMLNDADLIAGAAHATGNLVSELPNLLTKEREAAIRQFMDSVSVETTQTRQLVMELRSTLQAGTVTSESLNTTIRSFDQLVAGFRAPASEGGSAKAPGRPFDITEYTAAAAQISRAAGELGQVIAGIGQSTPALAQAADQASATLQKVITFAYWRVFLLIGFLLLGGLGTALAYRVISRRWLR
jgi:hypothetical protein